MLWLALQFPRLGLEVWSQSSLENEASSSSGGPHERPVVLLEDSRIRLLNDAARRAGIRPGATLATAHSIAADIVHHQRDIDREEKRLRFIGEALYRFSGQVSLEPPDALVLEVGASLRLFGDAQVLAGEAARLCSELGHEARTALARTPGAALAMATSGSSHLESVPLALARLPDAGHLERLANMGLKTLGALMDLPDAALGKRFGPELVGYLARLAGRAPDPRAFLEPADRFDQALHLLEPVKDKEALLSRAGQAPMARLLAELELWLVSHQLGAEQLIWSFSSHSETDRVVLPVAFARAQQQQGAFDKITRLRIEQVALPDDILNVRLETHRLVPWLGGTRQLFRLLPGDDGLSEADTSGLIDQLLARLGRGACARISALDQHAPEAAWQVVRPGGRTAGAARSTDLPAARPLWLFDPPHPTDPDRLTLLKGPERIRTAWWREHVWRDYYVASLESGARCWAFVDARNQWYLHGYFG
jgi:protein ImuB